MKKDVVKFTNRKGEAVEVWLTSSAHDPNYKHDIMRLWVKHGYMPSFLPVTITVDTYVTDRNGCYNRYNPQINYKTHKIAFNWVLADTAENRARIIAEIKRLANA